MPAVLPIILLLFSISTTVTAQLGTSNIGNKKIGTDQLHRLVIGNAGTPKCIFPGTCGVPCPVYRFTGSGNWDIPGNWSDNVVPPVVLPDCYEIIIDPTGNAECLLNSTLLVLNPGSKLTVMPGKKLRIPGRLINRRLP